MEIKLLQGLQFDFSSCIFVTILQKTSKIKKTTAKSGQTLIDILAKVTFL